MKEKEPTIPHSTTTPSWSQKVKGRGSAVLGIIGALLGFILIIVNTFIQIVYEKKIELEGLLSLFGFSAACLGIDTFQKK